MQYSFPIKFEDMRLDQQQLADWRYLHPRLFCNLHVASLPRAVQRLPAADGHRMLLGQRDGEVHVSVSLAVYRPDKMFRAHDGGELHGGHHARRRMLLVFELRRNEWNVQNERRSQQLFAAGCPNTVRQLQQRNNVLLAEG